MERPMTAAGDYRERVESVRQAARERLAALRAERLARKRYGARPAAAGGAAEEARGAEIEPESDHHLRYRASASATLFAADAAGRLPETPGPAPAEVCAAEEDVEIIDLDEPLAPFQEAGDAVLLEEPLAPLNNSGANGDRAAAFAAQAHAASAGLHSLPGIGPGLIWVLEQQGLRSLADLAKADKARLREALGLLGPFIDIDGWIAHARTAAR